MTMEPRKTAAPTQPLASPAMPASIHRRGKQPPIPPRNAAQVTSASQLQAAKGDDDLMSEPPETQTDASQRKP